MKQKSWALVSAKPDFRFSFQNLSDVIFILINKDNDILQSCED